MAPKIEECRRFWFLFRDLFQRSILYAPRLPADPFARSVLARSMYLKHSASRRRQRWGAKHSLVPRWKGGGWWWKVKALGAEEGEEQADYDANGNAYAYADGDVLAYADGDVLA